MGALLLVERPGGDIAAVMFPTVDAARDWEDQHPGLSVVGVAISEKRSVVAGWAE